MRDPKLVPETRARITRGDFEAVFAFGECFRFALRLHDRWGYKIRGIRSASNPAIWGHVWALKEREKGIDIRGIYREDLLAALANDGKPAAIEDVAPGELLASIKGRD